MKTDNHLSIRGRRAAALAVLLTPHMVLVSPRRAAALPVRSADEPRGLETRCPPQRLDTRICEPHSWKDSGLPQPSETIANTTAVLCFELEVVGASSGSELESITKILITELCSQ